MKFTRPSCRIILYVVFCANEWHHQTIYHLTERPGRKKQNHEVPILLYHSVWLTRYQAICLGVRGEAVFSPVMQVEYGN